MVYENMLKAVVVLTFSSGCILPPPIEEVAVPVNNPPRILPDQLSPVPTDGPAFLSVNCDSVHFFAALSDPDGDVLYWRVFINYHSYPQPVRVDIEQPDVNQPTRRRSIQFQIDPSDARFGTDPIGRPHMVELLVADQPFYEDERPPVARAVTEDEYGEPGLTDSFIWTVGLEDTPCPTG